MIRILGGALIGVFFLVFSFNRLGGTTIIPFKDLGSLSKHADAVVLAQVLRNFEDNQEGITRFKSKLLVLDPVKGDMEANEIFEVAKWQRYRIV